ncbi:MAG TPA: class I SAM-dependent methyltransferase [Pirellulaceae bacterium]|nr:class I SAM-dependent methyltransferase [Pirellulaceae bacterium]HMO93764.1 class I SAM-dependent methyltransferase [Pirellulaceae bacterium]
MSSIASSNHPDTGDSTELFWEPVAERRWGQYISSIELEAIQFALKQVPAFGLALEIGAEGGRWSKILADQGWQMTCTDINADALTVCQKRIPGANCILVDQNSTQLPCDSNSVGILLAIEVHEIVEKEWFVHEANRVLSDNGVFVGVFQNARSWRALMRNLKRDADGEFIHYTASYAPWRTYMRKQGFKMLKEVGLCWMPFGRMSDSSLIPMAVRLEQLLRLRKITTFSPWIVFVAQKKTRP